MSPKALPPEILAELQAEYLEAIPALIQNLYLALQKKNFSELEKQFHKLAGSGTTYGFPEITQVSRAIELYIKKGAPLENLILESLKTFESLIDGARKKTPLPQEKIGSVLKKLAA